MSSYRAPSVAKQSSSLAGRIKPIFPSSRRWSSTGRENYRIIPRKSPIQTGLERATERSRRTRCMGFALFAPSFSFASGRAVPMRTAATKSTHFICYRPLDTGTGSLGSLPNLIPHHQLIQHSLTHTAGRLAASMTWPTIQTRSTRPAFPIIK